MVKDGQLLHGLLIVADLKKRMRVAGDSSARKGSNWKRRLG
jgi:hypothetical protein